VFHASYVTSRSLRVYPFSRKALFHPLPRTPVRVANFRSVKLPPSSIALHSRGGAALPPAHSRQPCFAIGSYSTLFGPIPLPVFLVGWVYVLVCELDAGSNSLMDPSFSWLTKKEFPGLLAPVGGFGMRIGSPPLPPITPFFVFSFPRPSPPFCNSHMVLESPFLMGLAVMFFAL